MKGEYDHKKIEKKWQSIWEKKKAYVAKNPGAGSKKGKKFYGLIEFPYPSGAGLHVGHIRSNTAMDIISRKRRMQGYNVIYPIGWDAFGLPTENYAIKTGIPPAKVTKQNTDTFRRQLKALGFSFDWSREIDTTDPKYYKWTQWIFLQFWKKGLAYKAKTEINWCPVDKIGLANEEVVGGVCDRCGSKVEKREKEQWMLAITKYADRLDKDLDLVDYLPKIKIQQRNWIGKSEGAEIDFKVGENKITVFTTRPDTIFGATYLVLSPEHPILSTLNFENKDEVKKYVASAKKKTEIERSAEDREKTGVELEGVKAINPATKEAVSIWVADYVLPQYGTGAIMAVPAHDERDFAFAKKYGLPIKQVVMPDNLDLKNPPQQGKENTTREVVHIILRNPKTKEVLVMFLKGEHWRGNEPVNFIIGGIEKGEDEVSAATREIKEETGYTHVKFVERVPFDTQAKFFAAHKNVNRVVHVQTLVFDLVGEQKVAIEEDEYFTKDSHEFKWIPYEKVAGLLNIPDDKASWKYFLSGGYAYPGSGILIHSDKFDGMDSEKAKKVIVEFVGGKMVTKYKLRDWVFSRQRYWGEPIPLVYCEKDGWVPVSDKDLPVVLPKVPQYKPTDTGESPLAAIKSWISTKCPKCKGPAKRETDTMPNWAGSSWYYLRYTDPKDSREFASPKALKYWIPEGVDWYNGGMEHTTLHLLYSRFWHKFLYDLKLVPSSEPYRKRTSHGLILADGGEKMSKSKGNVVNPDDLVQSFGADTIRLYEMFMGPFDQPVSWNTDSMLGPRRFLERVWKLATQFQKNSERSHSAYNLPAFAPQLHRTIKKVSEDIEAMRFNTAISSMMILLNEMEKTSATKKDFKIFIQLLYPFAPHIAEEIWSELGEKKLLQYSTWPEWSEKIAKELTQKIAVQVNGKVRAEITIEEGEEQASVESRALKEVGKYLEGKPLKRVIYVKGRLINIVA